MSRHNDHTLKEVLTQMVDTYKLKSRLHQTKIRQFWTEVMGTTINSYTTELYLRGKKLYITIDSASLKQELSFAKDKIKKVLNEDLGEEYIEEVIIR